MAKQGAEITFSTGVTDPPWSLAGDECSSCDMCVDIVMEKPHKRNEGLGSPETRLKYHSIRKEVPSITLKGRKKGKWLTCRSLTFHFILQRLCLLNTWWNKHKWVTAILLTSHGKKGVMWSRLWELGVASTGVLLLSEQGSGFTTTVGTYSSCLHLHVYC